MRTTYICKRSKMVSQWRAAGMSYLQYSAICARLVRRCLKPEFKSADIGRFEESALKAVKWENGKPVGEPKKINMGQ